METIPLDVATQLIEATKTRADEIENPMVVTIANSEGNLIAQHRIGDTWLTSINTSRSKTYTSATLGMPTHELTEASGPGNSLYGLDTRDDDRTVVSGSGYLLERNDEVVDAIDVSGGTITQDRDVAEAGVERQAKLVEADAVPSDD